MNVPLHVRSHVRLAVGVLGPRVLREPPLAGPPKWPGTTTAQDWAKQFILFASARMGFDLPRMAFRYSPSLTHAGQIKATGGSWYIDLADQYRTDITTLAAVLAHELAHYLLDSKGVKLHPDRKHEELTDVVAALAGFGQIMARAYKQKSKSEIQVEGATVYTRTHTTKLGYLSSRDIRAVAAIQQQIASGQLQRRWWPLDPSHEKSIICPVCATRSGLPNVTATIDLSCRTCGFRQRLTLKPRWSLVRCIRAWLERGAPGA